MDSVTWKRLTNPDCTIPWLKTQRLSSYWEEKLTPSLEGLKKATSLTLSLNTLLLALCSSSETLPLAVSSARNILPSCACGSLSQSLCSNVFYHWALFVALYLKEHTCLLLLPILLFIFTTALSNTGHTIFACLEIFCIPPLTVTPTPAPLSCI